MLDVRINALNMGRDMIQDIVNGPFVLVIDERVSVTLATLMPDFYSWRVVELTL